MFPIHWLHMNPLWIVCIVEAGTKVISSDILSPHCWGYDQKHQDRHQSPIWLTMLVRFVKVGTSSFLAAVCSADQSCLWNQMRQNEACVALSFVNSWMLNVSHLSEWKYRFKKMRCNVETWTSKLRTVASGADPTFYLIRSLITVLSTGW